MLPTDETRDLLNRIRSFVDSELIPLEPIFLRNNFAAEALLDQKRLAVKALGLWAPGVPQSLGGLGLGLVDLGLVSEELGRTPIGHYVFGAQAPDMGNLEILHRFGSTAQKERYLYSLASGEIRSCFAMTEPHTSGSNPTLLQTIAQLDGEDYVINGHKWFCTAADGARFAIIMAVTNPDAPPHQRASMFIADTSAPGWEFVRNIQIMGEAHGGYYCHAEIKLNQLRVHQSMRLGGEGEGFTIAQERLGPGRIHHCMRWLGIAKRMQEILCQRALQREIASGKLLADSEIIQTWIAENAADIAASRALILQTAAACQAHGFKAARDDVAIIKFQAAATLQKVIDRTLQALGSLGMTDDCTVAWSYRHERAARIYDGPDEVHKLSLAKRILKTYR